MGSPALPPLAGKQARPGQVYECLSRLSFAESEDRAPLRDDVRRGVGVTNMQRAPVVLVVPSANLHVHYTGSARCTSRMHVAPATESRTSLPGAAATR